MHSASASWLGDTASVFESDRPVAIVEDDPGVLESLRFMLDAAGYAVATYASATAFLRDDQGRARCLIVDHHMPQKTGLQLVEELRRQGDVRSVLLITAAPSPGIYAGAKALGIERVLEKPLDDDDLFAFIENSG